MTVKVYVTITACNVSDSNRVYDVRGWIKKYQACYISVVGSIIVVTCFESIFQLMMITHVSNQSVNLRR